MQIVFTVNGPGEIAGWLFPLTRALRDRIPGLGITVCLLPCVYSSGAETQVVERLGTVDRVLSVRESLALIWRGRGAGAIGADGPRLVFHLGGEPTLTLLLAARLRAPAYAYLERPPTLLRFFRKAFFSGLEALPKRLEAQPGSVVGELMVDAALLRRAEAPRPADGRRIVGLFTGSRRFMVGPAVPYFAALVDLMSPRFPEIDWVMARSDHIGLDFLRKLPDPPENRDWPASRVRFEERGDGCHFVTEGGNRIEVLSGRDVLSRAEVALTFPGTSTGELAASGVPMVVAMPTYEQYRVPLPGIAGYIDRIPVVGHRLKQMIGQRLLRGLPFLALPNRRAGRMLVPEFVGRDLHPEIASALEGFLSSDTSALREALRAAMGAPGAADALAAEIAAHFGRSLAGPEPARGL